MRFLVLGGSGQVGTELQELARKEPFDLTVPDRKELDLEDPSAIERLFASGSWSAVINAAAYTNVDRAESETSVAFSVNADAPARLAAEAGKRGIPIIHISTDYVFDGKKGAPYFEDDEAHPLNVYGASKLAGEEGVRARNPHHIILRTSWVYSPFGKNFIKTILRLAGEREKLTIVADQRGCPTAAGDIAKACLDLARRCALQPEHVRFGTYHITGGGEATWFEFAQAIVDQAKDRIGSRPQLVPIRTADYPTPASRPADTRLDCTAVVREFGLAQRPWQAALAETIERLGLKEMSL